MEEVPDKKDSDGCVLLTAGLVDNHARRLLAHLVADAEAESNRDNVMITHTRKTNEGKREEDGLYYYR